MNASNCELPDFNLSSKEIIQCLAESKRIAVVGLSPKENRDSNKVARYLLNHGYEIVPINPGQKEILGQKCYKTLQDIPFPVDIANLFVNSKRVPPFVDQAIEKNIPTIWMQLGIVHNEAAKKARESGLQVFMNMCIKTQHQKNASELARLKATGPSEGLS
jgi:predicted CoA-binding protein